MKSAIADVLEKQVKDLLPEFDVQTNVILQKAYNMIIEEGDKMKGVISNPENSLEYFQDIPVWMIVAAVLSSMLALVGIYLFVRSRRKSNPLSRGLSIPSNIRPPGIVIPNDKTQNKLKNAAVNTEIDVDEFMLRIFSNAMIVRRHKPHEMKWRCIKVNEMCEMCMFKSYRRVGYVIPAGGAYIKLPLKELLSCFRCEGSQPVTFMLEFRSKSMQLSAEYGLDDAYLFQGFRAIARRIKVDSTFLPQWEKRFRYLMTPKKNSFRLLSTPSKKNDPDDDMNSVTTINTMLTR